MTRTSILSIGSIIVASLVFEPALTHGVAGERGRGGSRGGSSSMSRGSFRSSAGSSRSVSNRGNSSRGSSSRGSFSRGDSGRSFSGRSFSSGGGSARSYSGSSGSTRSYSGSSGSTGSFSGSSDSVRSYSGSSDSARSYSGRSSGSDVQSVPSVPSRSSGRDSGGSGQYWNSGPNVSGGARSSAGSSVQDNFRYTPRSTNRIEIERGSIDRGSPEGTISGAGSRAGSAFMADKKGDGKGSGGFRSGGQSGNKGSSSGGKKSSDGGSSGGGFKGKKEGSSSSGDGIPSDGGKKDGERFRSRGGDKSKSRDKGSDGDGGFPKSGKFPGNIVKPGDGKFDFDKRRGDGDRDRRGDGDRDRHGDGDWKDKNHWSKWHSHHDHDNWFRGNWRGNWDRHRHDWDDDWWWDNSWRRRRFFWGVTGWWFGPSIYNWGYYPYYNPYCTHPIYIGGTIYDYNRPLVIVDYSASPQDEALRRFESARAAFYNGNYAGALAEVDQAILQRPGDAPLHEFRALVLFAMRQYEPAAATINSLLAVGPGWDWATMRQLYPSVDVYTVQLRALEDFRRENPRAGYARFLLAYHYLTCGHNDAAVAELRQVVALQPEDRVASQLLATMTQPPPDQADQGAVPTPPAPLEEPAPAKPLDAAALVGKWSATRPDGSAVELALSPDSKFTWKYTREGKTNEFSGTYTVANNLLVLQQSPQEVMVGRIEPAAEKGFRFVLIGGPPDDEGLTFKP